MNILLIPSWYPKNHTDVGGVFFRDQALVLKAYGHDVCVISVNSFSIRTLVKSYQRPPLFELDEGVPTYRSMVWAALPRVPYGNYLLWKRQAVRLLDRYVAEQGMPDIVHAHAAIYAGAVAVEWAKNRGVPVILTEHSTGFARKVYRPWQLALAEKAAAGADACIAVSPALGKLLGKELPRSQGRWAWVPNVVASRFADDTAAIEKGNRPLRFLNLALMTTKKGQMDLLKAFARAFGKSSERAELWMGGDGPLRGKLEAHVRELGIAQRVRFLGRVSPVGVPGLLAQVDAMVISSHYETFGVVAAEALMSGVPVIATRCGGPECIVGEGDGFLVPVRDPDALASAMRDLVERIDQFDSKAIAQRAKDRFSGTAVARQLTAIYDHVLENGRGH